MVSGPGWGLEAMMAVYCCDDRFVSRMQILQSEDSDEAVGCTHAITTFPLESMLSKAGCSFIRATDKRTDGSIKERCNGDATLFAVVMELGGG